MSKWNDKRLYAAALCGFGAVAWAYFVKGDYSLFFMFLGIEVMALVGYALFVSDEDQR